MDDLATLNRRNVRARIHIESDSEFVNRVVIDRDHAEYPDPFLRDVTDAELLSDYLIRTKQAIDSYTPANNNEAKQCEEFYRRESERVNAQMGRILFPDSADRDLAHLVADLEKTALGTGYAISARDMPWELYETLYARPLEDLRYLAAYFTVQRRGRGGRGFDTSVRILNAIRYVRGDPTVSLDNFIAFIPLELVKQDIQLEVDGEPVELKEGVPFSDIKRELRNLGERFDSLIVALGFARIREVTNYHHPTLANGLYDSYETNISEPIPATGLISRNVVAHEFFHAIQDIIGTLDLMAEDTAVEFDTTPDEWETVAFPAVDTRLIQIHDQTKHLWFRFRNGEFPELCDYQTANIHEMYAVGFEAYIESPDVLRNTQPEVYELVDTIVA